MTAESLKPFLNLPNAPGSELKAHCAQKSTAKRCLAVLGCILVVAILGTLIGVQIWHLNRTAALEREVDDLKLQLQLYNRAGEFNDYEFDNELFANPDEYETGYEPDLDPDLPIEASELLESGLASDGAPDDGDNEDDESDDDHDGGDDEREYVRMVEDMRRLDLGADSDANDEEGEDYSDLYDSEDISVTAAAAAATTATGGKRRARSISGVTRQGVPIVDEPYVPRRNRTRRPHRIFEQLRQRPEEVVTPPTSPEMFSWDAEGRSTQTSHRRVHSQQQQAYGSISIRPLPHESHHFRGPASPSTPMPAYSSPASPLYYQRNELTSGNPTKAPAPVYNRMSRVQSTNGETRRARTQQHTRFHKVISNPGTQQELVRAAETSVNPHRRKSGASTLAAEPYAKGVHFVKEYVHGVRHQYKRHTHWTSKEDATQQAIDSGSFRFENDQLIVKERGLYYVYAQVTYDNHHETNGFRVLVRDQQHLSCTVHSQGANTNTCFTAGLVKVDQPDTRIVVEDVDQNRHHLMYPDKTFFGAFKVGRLPPAVKAQKLQQQQQQQRQA